MGVNIYLVGRGTTDLASDEGGKYIWFDVGLLVGRLLMENGKLKMENGKLF